MLSGTLKVQEWGKKRTKNKKIPFWEAMANELSSLDNI